MKIIKAIAQRVQYYCTNCGTPISSGAYCASCLSGGNGGNGGR